MPVVGYVGVGSADAATDRVRAFREGLGETGYVEGQNVTIEYHWLEGQFDRLPELMADFVRRRVAVIATPGTTPGSTLSWAGRFHAGGIVLRQAMVGHGLSVSTFVEVRKVRLLIRQR